MERRKTIALLPDREPATAQEWLSGQPQISIVACDRGGSYALAAARALPQASQVADRWHSMENASHAFLDAVRKSMRQIRTAIGAATINPDLLTAAERLQYDGYLRREEENAVILSMTKELVAIKEIVPSTGAAAAWSGKSCAATVRTSFVSARVRWSFICRGLTRNGRLGAATARSCGDSSKPRGSAAALV